jgi:hypothetical protein
MDNEFLLGKLAASMENMEKSMLEIKDHLKRCPVRVDLETHVEDHKKAKVENKSDKKYTITTVIALLAFAMPWAIKLIWK